jgi:hypothetical protein
LHLRILNHINVFWYFENESVFLFGAHIHTNQMK